jgi:hypothetical protein
LSAFVTEYTLTVNARTTAGREVKLQRTTQSVGIGAFSFGIFCGMSCSFFAGPDFNFGGRTHTNGNLYLAEGNGNTLTLGDKADAYKDVIRTSLSNGLPTSSNYTGTVRVTTNPGSSSYRTLAMSEGSYNPLTGSGNSSWPTISTSASPTGYNHNLIDGKGSLDPTHSTGAQQLNLAVALLGNGATQAVDLNRRALSGESMTVTAERYYSQASLRILLSDNPADITNLPCVDGGTAPFDLSLMATTSTANWATAGGTLQAIATNLAKNTTGYTLPLPLAESGAAAAATAYNSLNGYWQPNGYPIIRGFIKIEEQTSYGNGSACGTWKDVTAEILGYGYVGRNINPVPQSFDNQTLNPQWPGTSLAPSPGSPLAGIWAIPNPPSNTTQIGPQYPTAASSYWTNGAALMTAVSTPGTPKSCLDPHPNAIIRLERIRDNPSSLWPTYVQTSPLKLTNPNQKLPYQAPISAVCGVDPSSATKTLVAGWTPYPQDFWPNVLFDTREGELRDDTMSAANRPTLNGTMHYIEIDAKNLANWFAGKIGTVVTSGQATKDPNYATNNFVLYISDRRGNYEDSTVQTISGGWPPLSYTTHETGEYGWTDIVNSTNAANGCPNVGLDVGEDENADNTFAGSLYWYGASQKWIHAAGQSLPNLTTNPGQIGIWTTLSGTGLLTNDNCASIPSYSSPDGIWPMLVAQHANAPRENPPLFFRRAVKIVNANNLTALGACPGGQNCGLAIATENPVYVQGDYNTNSAGGGSNWSDPYVASSISADAVTLLSNNWNDVNSFSTPYSLGNRNATTSYYRVAILAGVAGTFPQPGGSTTSTVPQDFGTDGGVHNFLRYIENWGGQYLYYKGSIVELFYSRQANATYKCCATVYSPPSRGYKFDTDFLDPIKLPPRTPLFRDVNTTGWTRLMLASQ